MRQGTKYILLLILVILFFVVDILLGSVKISFLEVIDVLKGNGGINETIVLGFRLPKAVAALTAGIALSVAGMLMQTFFRNPLAGPYVLGVNSLASLSVALFMLAGGVSASVFYKMGVPFAASIGAFGGLLILLVLSRKIKSSTHLLLVGMMIGFLAGALQSVLEYLSNPGDLKNFVLWNMASVSNVTGTDLVIFVSVVLLVSSLCLFLIKPLNVLLLGDEHAFLLGISVKKVKFFILIIVAILSGVATAYCGPIGFVGLAMPHLVRLLFKTTHHLHQLIGSVLLGSCFMLFCDIIGNLPFFEITLPVNVVTSLFGAPFVLWLIFKQKNSFE